MPRRGFSLLELLAAAAIAGVLFAAALDAYREQTLRAHRADGRNALLRAALQQEEMLLRRNHYSGDLSELGGELSAQGRYRLRLNEAGGGCAAEPGSGQFRCYALTARPVAGQRRDRRCAALYLHHDGRRGARNASGTEAAGCW